ncbi:hypothetical protein LQL77_32065, partial [Rhodococcus cerastii]|nr:hypothetical protein [Rhodococcus cerastii]
MAKFDPNRIVGTIKVNDGIVLRNGVASIRQGLGSPDVTKGIWATVVDRNEFKVEGMGPFVDAQWQIYAPTEHGPKPTTYWVDSHLTTTIFGDVKASCEILAGRPKADEKVSPARLSEYTCSWTGLKVVGEHPFEIKPTLTVSKKQGLREISDKGQADQILEAYCTDKTKCNFVPESFSDKVIGPEKLVGTPVRNTTSFMTTPQYGWTHRIGWTDAVGGKLTVSGKIPAVVELALEGNYTHTWGQDKTFTETVPL